MTARAARVAAQGKINLALRILARERSGYHSIETLFARIALTDQVTVRVGGGGRTVECRGPTYAAPGLGPPECNLAFRAAAAFAAVTGWPSGFTIDLEKRIPVGGGLGGGSADAGATLRALNALAPRPLPEHELLRLAGTLGADVPFLTSTVAMALGWGHGERLLALSPLPERYLVLVVPAFGVATADAYRWWAESHNADAPSPVLLSLADLSSWDRVTPWCANELAAVVTARHPRVREIADSLRSAGARIAQMSGSGSVVFGVFEAPPDPASLAVAPDEQVVLTRTATRVAPVEMVEGDSRQE